LDRRDIVAAWPDHDPLRPEELKTLIDHGVEVGSHTMGHKILTRCTPDETRRELEESKRFIESATGKPCEEFSYPNGGRGDFDSRTGAAVREGSYTCAVTAIPMRVPHGQDPFEIPRYSLPTTRRRRPSSQRSSAGTRDTFARSRER
jgi:peptidoglycan/xylan/chitin deacetylase (PgdA/CDA1 family)